VDGQAPSMTRNLQLGGLWGVQRNTTLGTKATTTVQIFDDIQQITNPLGDACEVIGDINGDGTVDLIDVISGLQILTGETIIPISNCGVNKIGLDDVLFGLKEISK
jgi:hypothetical protein